MSTLILALIVAPLIGWALHRDIRRAVRRRRLRVLTADMRVNYEAVQRQIREALMPAMADVAKAASKAAEAFAKFGYAAVEAGKRTDRP